MNIDIKILKILANKTQQYRKNYVPQSSGVYSRDTKLTQYLKIHHCNLPY